MIYNYYLEGILVDLVTKELYTSILGEAHLL